MYTPRTPDEVQWRGGVLSENETTKLTLLIFFFFPFSFPYTSGTVLVGFNVWIVLGLRREIWILPNRAIPHSIAIFVCID